MSSLRRVLLSLLLIGAIAASTAGATYAVFSSSAAIGETFATGSLNIEINGQTNATDTAITNAAPNQWQLGNFEVKDAGSLAALHLDLATAYIGGNGDLYNNLYVVMSVGPTPAAVQSALPPNDTTVVYSNWLNQMSSANLLTTPAFSQLNAGQSVEVYYWIKLVDSGGNQNSLMGQSTTFNFVATGTNP